MKKRSKLVGLFILLTGMVNAQDQTINGDLKVGENSTDTSTKDDTTGKRLYFQGVHSNHDNIWMARHNDSHDNSRLRLNLGDDGGEYFDVGYYHWSDNNTWRSAFSVRANGTANFNGTASFNGSVGIGDFSISSNFNGLAIGDSDTGIKQMGDGKLAFFTNNVEGFRINNNGSIGIGVNNTSSRILHVKGEANGSIPLLEGVSNTEKKFFSFKRTDDTQEAYFSYTGSSIGIGTNSVERMRISQNGNVGIGTDSPNAKLEIEGGVFDSGFKYSGKEDGKNYVEIGTHGLGAGSSVRRGFIKVKDNEETVKVFFTSGNTQNSWINTNGNFGIGTDDPKNKLSVNGTIWATEVKIQLTDAGDWVFDDSYYLRPLNEVANYIKENKHLPEIPSAEEFRENDLKVSEMTNKLLVKIEELTLYTIEQENKIKAQEERLSKLEKLLLKE